MEQLSFEEKKQRRFSLSSRTVLLVRFLRSLRLSFVLDFQPDGHLTCLPTIIFFEGFTTPPKSCSPELLGAFPFSFSLHLNVRLSPGIQRRLVVHPLRFQTRGLCGEDLKPRALGKVKVLCRVSALCQDFRPTRESLGPSEARSARLHPLPHPPPAPGSSHLPRPTVRAGTSQPENAALSCRLLINPGRLLEKEETETD